MSATADVILKLTRDARSRPRTILLVDGHEEAPRSLARWRCIPLLGDASREASPTDKERSSIVQVLQQESDATRSHRQ
jgi:hypothetical protein